MNSSVSTEVSATTPVSSKGRVEVELSSVVTPPIVGVATTGASSLIESNNSEVTEPLSSSSLVSVTPVSSG